MLYRISFDLSLLNLYNRNSAKYSLYNLSYIQHYYGDMGLKVLNQN